MDIKHCLEPKYICINWFPKTAGTKNVSVMYKPYRCEMLPNGTLMPNLYLRINRYPFPYLISDYIALFKLTLSEISAEHRMHDMESYPVGWH